MTVYSVVKFGECFAVTANNQAKISFSDSVSAIDFAQTIVADDDASVLNVVEVFGAFTRTPEMPRHHRFNQRLLDNWSNRNLK